MCRWTARCLPATQPCCISTINVLWSWSLCFSLSPSARRFSVPHSLCGPCCFVLLRQKDGIIHADNHQSSVRDPSDLNMPGFLNGEPTSRAFAHWEMRETTNNCRLAGTPEGCLLVSFLGGAKAEGRKEGILGLWGVGGHIILVTHNRNTVQGGQLVYLVLSDPDHISYLKCISN